MRLSRLYSLLSFLLIGGVFVVSASNASAAQLSSVSDRISTSRPSPSTPLSAASSVFLAPVFNNASRFLASDSAQIIRTSNNVVQDAAITISSQSANLTTVYFADSTGSVQQAGTDVLFVPITAMHTIQFTVVNTIPTSGDIVFTFPTLTSGDADNDASPSATTFQFNNVVSGTGGRDVIDVYDDGADISANVTITETEPSAGNAGVISINVDSGTIAAGSVVKIYLGCTTSTSSSCTAGASRIINPTKSNATAGNDDSWRLRIDTEDASDIVLDSAKISISTIESVLVRAEVEPSLTFTITGIANGTNLSTVSGSCFADSTNAGNTTTATDVDLGFLSNGAINLAAQELTVSTNAATGYTINATSSGQFINPSTGFWITGANSDTALTNNDVPAPAEFTASGTPDFGISPCGARVTNATWDGDQTALSWTSSAKFSNPYNSGTNSYYATLATYTGGPVDTDDTVVRYAATISGITPAGIYRNIFTYIATATF